MLPRTVRTEHTALFDAEIPVCACLAAHAADIQLRHRAEQGDNLDDIRLDQGFVPAAPPFERVQKLQQQAEHRRLRQRICQQLFGQFQHIGGCHILVEILADAVVALDDLRAVQVVAVACLEELVMPVGKRPLWQRGFVLAALRQIAADADLAVFLRKQQQHTSAVDRLDLTQHDRVRIRNHTTTYISLYPKFDKAKSESRQFSLILTHSSR